MPRRPSCGESAIDVANLLDVDFAHPRHSTGRLGNEIRLFLELALPTTLLNFGFVISPLVTASWVGLKFGATYLSAFSLANLTGNLCNFSLLAGMFSAADTLSPQAFGKGDYREVGLIAMRGVAAGVVIIFPINVLLVLYLERVFLALGQDPTAAKLATQWYQIFVTAVPFYVLYNVVWKFLSAQHVMRPLIVVSVFSCTVILPIALEVFTSHMGFLGSAVAYVTFQAAQATLLVIYLAWFEPHVPGSWPGLSCWKEALQWQPMLDYLHLGSGGMLAQSEWIYWEALGLIIGKIGVLELSAHTIPNQVTMAMCMAPFAFGVALSIRMGMTISQSVSQTKQIVVEITVGSVIFFGILTIGVYVCSDWIIRIFTTNEEVKGLASQVWLKVCLYIFNVAIFAMNSGIATGLGMQWRLGAVNFFFLWIFGVPVTYYFALIRGGGLEAAWTWINVPYVCMNVALLVSFTTKDWYAVQDKICRGDVFGAAYNNVTDLGNPHAEEKTGLLKENKAPSPHYYG